MLSIIIPAQDEEEVIEKTIREFNQVLTTRKIKHEILVVNDHSIDNTCNVLIKLEKEIKELRHINNLSSKGFGTTIIKGLDNFNGDYVTIVMADLSDDPQDLIGYYDKIKEGFDCVFGSRFIQGGKVVGYPRFKLMLNRLGNNFIRLLFWIKYNDITNPFKLYSRETIFGLKPFISRHFNLEVEIPLKAIVRGYSYAVIPNTWRNRTKGLAKFKIIKMGAGYFFVILYCFIENSFNGRYYKNN